MIKFILNFIKKTPSLQNLNGILNFNITGSSALIIVDNHKIRLPQLTNEFMRDNASIKRIEIYEAGLEDVFISLTK